MLLVTALVALLATTLLATGPAPIPGWAGGRQHRKALALGEEARFRAELRADLAFRTQWCDGSVAQSPTREQDSAAFAAARPNALLNVNNLSSPAALTLRASSDSA